MVKRFFALNGKHFKQNKFIRKSRPIVRNVVKNDSLIHISRFYS